MSLSFTKFEVRAYDHDHLDLFWCIENTDEEVDLYDFYVLKSVDGPGGPFKEVTGPARNLFQFRDSEVNQLHNWRNHFYKVRVVERETGCVEEVGPAFLEAEADLIAIEVRRRFRIIMNEYAGTKVLIYPAMTSGFRCPHCFDRGANHRRTTLRQRTQNCATCYDMTFVGGFQNPLLVACQKDPSPKSVQRMDIVERSLQDTTWRLSAFPPLKPKDMIVERENVRWQVEKVTNTTKLGAVIHQEPVLHRIPKTDIRYTVPVDFSLLDRVGPEREFTRPMSLGTETKTPLTDFLDNLLGDS